MLLDISFSKNTTLETQCLVGKTGTEECANIWLEPGGQKQAVIN